MLRVGAGELVNIEIDVPAPRWDGDQRYGGHSTDLPMKRDNVSFHDWDIFNRYIVLKLIYRYGKIYKSAFCIYSVCYKMHSRFKIRNKSLFNGVWSCFLIPNTY